LAINGSTGTNGSGEFAPARFRLIGRAHGPRYVVRVYGELDLATCPQLVDLFNIALARGSRHVVVDLSHVDFIDLVALQALRDAQHRMEDRQGAFTVVYDPGSDGVVSMMMELTRLDEVFDLAWSHDEVLEFRPRLMHRTSKIASESEMEFRST
jgi:anti-anti-sigma factor